MALEQVNSIDSFIEQIDKEEVIDTCKSIQDELWTFNMFRMYGNFSE